MSAHFAFMYIIRSLLFFLFFFFNDTATTEIYTLSLHDALPISGSDLPVARRTPQRCKKPRRAAPRRARRRATTSSETIVDRSEEHTSELQSPCNLVCRLLLEKKKKKKYQHNVQTAATTTDQTND